MTDMTRPSTWAVLAGAALPRRWRTSDPAGVLATSHGAADRDRDRLAGRLAMSRAFRLYAGDDTRPSPQTLVAYRPHGRPYLPAAPALYCSVAHSHGWAIAGISSRPIGVDIEKIRQRHPALPASVATPGEIARVAAYVTDPAHLVTILWTMKEAVMKATGEGLRIPPRHVRVDEFDGRIARVIVTASGVSPAEFRVATGRTGTYCLSIALGAGQ